ncbi:hypothetical protein U1Q18_031507, partial [Sarracenia purpurea var. burkii]
KSKCFIGCVEYFSIVRKSLLKRRCYDCGSVSINDNSGNGKGGVGGINTMVAATAVANVPIVPQENVQPIPIVREDQPAREEDDQYIPSARDDHYDSGHWNKQDHQPDLRVETKPTQTQPMISPWMIFG